jgi:anti-sigma28 factor (negative regulator of flagellin synthesis)
MSTINNIGSSEAVQRVVTNPVQRTTPATTTDSLAAPRAADQVDLSGVDQYLQTLNANNIRTDLVTSVRSQIEAGTYEDENKLNTAADRLLNDLNK